MELLTLRQRSFSEQTRQANGTGAKPVRNKDLSLGVSDHESRFGSLRNLEYRADAFNPPWDWRALLVQDLYRPHLADNSAPPRSSPSHASI